MTTDDEPTTARSVGSSRSRGLPLWAETIVLLVSAVVLALLANMLVRLLWRYQVVRNWRSRRKARLAARRCSKEQSSRQTAEQDTDKL